MEIVINTKQCPCRTLNYECYISSDDCFEDDICSTCPLIRTGGVKLPKGHGDLIDRKAVIENGLRKGFCDWYDEIKMADTIIEADTGETE